MIIDKPKCPHCSVPLEETDIYDIEYDIEQLVLNKVGLCPECKRDYQWTESAVCTNWAVTNLHGV